jgi:subfamily B ATP-binding cassette protein MsbA
VFFVVAPVIGAVVNFVGKRLRKLSTKVQGAMGGITHVSSEMISGYKEMRSFGGEDYENKRFFDASYENFRQNMKVVVTSALNTPTVQFILSIAMGVLVFWCSLLWATVHRVNLLST